MRAEGVVAAIGAARRGIVPRALALEAGVRRQELQWLRDKGLLVPVGRAVDRLRDHPFDWASQCQAALDLAGPGAVLGLRSGARLHEYYRYRNTTAIEVVRPRGGHHRIPFGRLVETRWLPPDHVTVVDGLPVTTVARTFFDLCGDPDGGMSVRHPAHRNHMASVYNDALAHRGLSFTLAVAVLLVMAKRGRGGTDLSRQLLLRFGPHHTPTQSDSETVFAELVDAHGLPAPEKQVPMFDEEGFIGVVDFLWRDARLVVEIDSTWHDGPLDVERDARRDERLRRLGYTVRRWRFVDLVERPEAVAHELAMLLRVRTR